MLTLKASSTDLLRLRLCGTFVVHGPVRWLQDAPPQAAQVVARATSRKLAAKSVAAQELAACSGSASDALDVIAINPGDDGVPLVGEDEEAGNHREGGPS